MNELRDIQLQLTDMLKVFHDFCETESLQYFAVGGTALGAARHHGFIPWDDDIDIGMPRPDYERFTAIFNNTNKNKRYILEKNDSADPYFLYPFAKLYDTQTTLIENLRHPLKRGIFIDIYPFDGAGNSKTDSLSLLRRIKFLLFLRNMRVIRIVGKRKFYKNALLFFFQSFPRFLLNEKKVAKKINVLCQTFQYESSSYISNFVGAWGEKEIIPKKEFGKPVLYPFENIHIYCPENVDAYLSHIYGDWRTPPPKEKQITHHDYYLDLTKSYLE